MRGITPPDEILGNIVGRVSRTPTRSGQDGGGGVESLEPEPIRPAWLVTFLSLRN